jgi:nucleotide-binding universal stress UspA family protein
MKTILAVIDFSRMTTRVVAEAVSLAREINARLVLLNVTTPEAFAHDHAAFESLLGGADPGAGNGDGARLLPTIRGDSLQLVGDPVHVIIKEAARSSADYIMLGSQMRSKRPSAGDIASIVIGAARCPVIVVPSSGPKTRIRPGRKLRGRHSAVGLPRTARRPVRARASEYQRGRRAGECNKMRASSGNSCRAVRSRMR